MKELKDYNDSKENQIQEIEFHDVSDIEEVVTSLMGTSDCCSSGGNII